MGCFGCHGKEARREPALLKPFGRCPTESPTKGNLRGHLARINDHVLGRKDRGDARWQASLVLLQERLMRQADAPAAGIFPQILKNCAVIGKTQPLGPPFHFLVVAPETRDIQVDMSEQPSCIPVGQRCKPWESICKFSGAGKNLQTFFSFAAVRTSALKPTGEMNNLVRLAIRSSFSDPAGSFIPTAQVQQAETEALDSVRSSLVSSQERSAARNASSQRSAIPRTLDWHDSTHPSQDEYDRARFRQSSAFVKSRSVAQVTA